MLGASQGRRERRAMDEQVNIESQHGGATVKDTGMTSRISWSTFFETYSECCFAVLPCRLRGSIIVAIIVGMV